MHFLRSPNHFAFPADAYEHYALIMNVTAQFRGLPPHFKDPYFKPNTTGARAPRHRGSYFDGYKSGSGSVADGTEDIWGTGNQGWDAKWIENHFISAFVHKPLHVSCYVFACACLLIDSHILI